MRIQNLRFISHYLLGTGDPGNCDHHEDLNIACHNYAGSGVRLSHGDHGVLQVYDEGRGFWGMVSDSQLTFNLWHLSSPTSFTTISSATCSMKHRILQENNSLYIHETQSIWKFYQLFVSFVDISSPQNSQRRVCYIFRYVTTVLSTLMPSRWHVEQWDMPQGNF